MYLYQPHLKFILNFSQKIPIISIFSILVNIYEFKERTSQKGNLTLFLRFYRFHMFFNDLEEFVCLKKK